MSIFKYFKYLPLVALGKDVTNALKEKGADRPSYLTRRFIGAVIFLIGAFLSIEFGIEIDKNILQQLINDTDKLILIIMTGYGAGLGVYGTVKAIFKKIKEKKSGV